MIWDFERYEQAIALADEYGTEVSYRQLKESADEIAAVIGRRCLVFCLCKNTIGSFLGYLSFVNQKMVPLMLSSQLEEGLLDQLMEIYQPAYLWVPIEQEECFEGMKKVYEAYSYVLLKTSAQREFALYEELGLLLTTSGSTGSPKLVRQSYENIIENAKAIATYLELDQTERPITTLPMNYTYGLSIIHSHLLVGATLLITEKTMMQREFWTFLKEAHATSFGGVPYTYEILDKMRFTRMNLPDFRTMTQAGGKLTPMLHEKFAKWASEQGKKFIVMYGQCEATARMGYLPADLAVKKKGSMGIAIPGGRFRLMDAMGQLFYSLSVAMGIMIAYGSYMKDDTNLSRAIGEIEVFDTAIAVLAGIMIIPTVYVFMGKEGMQAGPGLMFVALPKVFVQMGRIGGLIGCLFFAMVLFAATTSAVSILEAVVSSFMDQFHVSRKTATMGEGVIALILGIIVCLGYNKLFFKITLPNGAEAQILDVMDYVSNNLLMPVVAIGTCILIGWVMKPKTIIDEVTKNGEKFGRKLLYVGMIKFIAPVLLLVLLLEALGVI